MSSTAQKILLPRRICQYSACGLADGCSGAPFGRPNYPALLDGYGSHRPPWNVAGVDYHVGVPDGAVLTDWHNLSGANISVAAAGVTLSGNFTFDHVDFTVGNGGYVYNPSGAASAVTVTNCKFGIASGVANSSNRVNDQNAATFTIRNCSFDGTSNTNAGSFITTAGSLTLEYNYFTKSTQHIEEFNSLSGSNKTLIYRFNLIYNQSISPGAHLNFLQFGNNSSTVNINVSYNTVNQSIASGGEGFQFYTNGSGAFYPSPLFTNNTMIAKLVGGAETISAMVHGSNSGETTGGTNSSNYFDPVGMFFPYYAGSMTPALGWTSTGNIDMRDGSIIVPGA